MANVSPGTVGKGERRPGDVAAQVANVAHRFPAYGCSVVDCGLEAGDGVPFAVGAREGPIRALLSTVRRLGAPDFLAHLRQHHWDLPY